MQFRAPNCNTPAARPIRWLLSVRGGAKVAFLALGLARGTPQLQRADIGGRGVSSVRGGAKVAVLPSGSHRDNGALVRAGGRDTIAGFAIAPARADIGGYGGSSPRAKAACLLE